MKRFLKKIPKILFWICFLPYVFSLAMGIYYAFAGYEVRAFVTGELIETLYGFEAFCEAAFSFLLILWYFWVIPLCLVYQAIYLFVKFYKWDKNKNSD